AVARADRSPRGTDHGHATRAEGHVLGGAGPGIERFSLDRVQDLPLRVEEKQADSQRAALIGRLPCLVTQTIRDIDVRTNGLRRLTVVQPHLGRVQCHDRLVGAPVVRMDSQDITRRGPRGVYDEPEAYRCPTRRGRQAVVATSRGENDRSGEYYAPRNGVTAR